MTIAVAFVVFVPLRALAEIELVDELVVDQLSASMIGACTISARSAVSARKPYWMSV
jgi:hypothetical protein